LKTAVWARQSWPIAEALPGFDPIKLGFVHFDEWVAACIVADPSEFKSSAFSVQAFALPLFVPTDHLYFDYGFRIGERWDGISSELIAAVRRSVTQLQRLATLDGLLASASHPNVNIYHAELRLCIGLIKDDTQLFSTTRESIAAWKQNIEWETPVIQRCSELAISVQQGRRSHGLAELERRRQDVKSLLK
jgi:hypothetical protein